MIVRQPTNAAAEEVSALREYRPRFESLVEDYVEEIVAEITHDLVRDQISSLVFRSNEALPKRPLRPHLQGTFFTDQVYRAHTDSPDAAAELLKFALVHQEHWDVADDLFDGDVTSGTETEVYATSQALQPLVVRLLGRLGQNAIAYWSRSAERMITAGFEELCRSPSTEDYVAILDRQAEYYGGLTGIAAIVAGADKSAVARANAAGRAYFKFEQVLLDVDQHREGDADPWNARRIMSEEDLLGRIRDWRADVTDYISDLADPEAARLRPIVDFDVAVWIENNDRLDD